MYGYHDATLCYNQPAMIEAVFVGIIGLAVGSFLNVVVDRLPAGQSLVRPPSHCPGCGRRLHPLEMVPLLSYLALRGRCRTCRSPIPLRVLVVEALTGGLFALAAWRFGVGVELAPVLVLLAALVALFFTDLEQQLLPNTLTILPTLALLAMAPWNPSLTWDGPLARVGQAALGGVLAAGIVLVVYVVSYLVLRRQGMGEGDIKLAALLGAGLGPALAGAALYMGVIGGGVVAIALLLSKRRGRRDPLPFGTFLTAAGAIATFSGPGLYRWYLGLLGVQ